MTEIPRATIIAATVVALGAFAIFLLFPAQPAEAASITFTSDSTITTDQTIASGEFWAINGVKVTITPGVTVINNGTISVQGFLINNGTLVNLAKGPPGEIFGIDNADTIINYGTLNSSGPFRMNVHFSPRFINNGTFNNAGDIGPIGLFANYNVTNNSGQISMDGPVINYGTLNNDGIIRGGFVNSGTIINSRGAGMGGFETFNSGTVLNFGILSLEQGSNSGIINNNGTLFSGGEHSSFDNSGTINNNGTFTINGDVVQLNNLSSGTINNYVNATIDNYETYNNTGTTNNAGTLNNKCGGIFISGGILTGNPVNYELCLSLAPLNVNNPEGGNHTVIATATESSGSPLVGISVTFNVTSGPNIGTVGINITDSAGNSSFTYTDTGGAGTDVIRASFNDQAGVRHYSNVAIKGWIAPPPPNRLELKQGTNNIRDGGTAELGFAIIANAITNSSTATQVNFTRINPDSSVDTEIVPLTLGSAQYSFTPNMLGQYAILADFGNGVIVEREISISFNVIPESPIGIIAIIGSSFAALGGFMLWKRRSRPL